MKLDPLQHLAVNRRFLNPKPNNWRLVVGMTLIVAFTVVLLMID